jgi:hypothetical protein
MHACTTHYPVKLIWGIYALRGKCSTPPEVDLTSSESKMVVTSLWTDAMSPQLVVQQVPACIVAVGVHAIVLAGREAHRQRVARGGQFQGAVLLQGALCERLPQMSMVYWVPQSGNFGTDGMFP